MRSRKDNFLNPKFFFSLKIQFQNPIQDWVSLSICWTQECSAKSTEFKKALESINEIKIKLTDELKKHQADGYSKQESLNLRKESERLEILEFLKWQALPGSVFYEIYEKRSKIWSYAMYSCIIQIPKRSCWPWFIKVCRWPYFLFRCKVNKTNNISWFECVTWINKDTFVQEQYWKHKGFRFWGVYCCILVRR